MQNAEKANGQGRTEERKMKALMQNPLHREVSQEVVVPLMLWIWCLSGSFPLMSRGCLEQLAERVGNIRESGIHLFFHTALSVFELVETLLESTDAL